MTPLTTMLWFIGMAIATAAILTITVLSAADIIRWHRPRRRSRQPSSGSPVPADSSITPDENPKRLTEVRSVSPTDGCRGRKAA